MLGAAGAAGVLTAAGGYRILEGGAADAAAALPQPSRSGIKHIVVVMMENRSFDHFLGWLPQVNPQADGKQAGLTYLDRYRVPHDTHHLTEFASCGFEDPDHSYEGGRIQLNGGACNGWLRSGLNDSLSIGYFEQADLQFLGQAVPGWTTFDRYFSAVMAETYPNRFYLHCAQTDRLHNSDLPIGTTFKLRSIWDRLKAKGVSGKYYFSDIPFTFLMQSHGPSTAKVGDASAPLPGTFFADAAAGTLPAVSYVDPQFLNEDGGLSNDDHPHADIRAGEVFFDHVPPGKAPDVSPRTSLRGFRVPTVVISPFARRGHISHQTFDHTSILKMIEWRWGLKPLTPRDQHAHNLATVLDFANPDTSTPGYAVDPFEWPALKQAALAAGWDLPR